MNYTLETLGPRVIFKDDRDASSGRGCRVYAAHFTPVVMDIWRHGVKAFAANKRVRTIRLTEGWRDVREGRDCHEEARAFDFTAEDEKGKRISEAEYKSIAAQIRAWLGDDYDVVLHGEGLGLHIHVEYDPKGRR